MHDDTAMYRVSTLTPARVLNIPVIDSLLVIVKVSSQYSRRFMGLCMTTVIHVVNGPTIYGPTETVQDARLVMLVRSRNLLAS
jgi:hypothetical protein